MTRNDKTIALGIVLALVGFLLGWGGVGPLTEERDDGYYMSDPLTLDRRSAAIVTHDTDLLRGRFHTIEEESFVDRFLSQPDEIRMQAVSSGAGGLFVGIAPAGAVDEYLDGVSHDEITDWDADQSRLTDIELTARGGTRSPPAPGTETFWVVSVSGTGTQTLDWTILGGDWAAVIMNTDASPRVRVEVAFGAKPPSGWNALHRISMFAGAVLLVAGGVLLYSGARRRHDAAPA